MNAIVPLELQRARKLLTAFCDNRNPGRSRHQGQLECVLEENDLLIVQVLSDIRRPLVKCQYSEPVWNLFLSGGSQEWQVYPHLPEAASVQEIIRELEQAPLHVHW